MALQLPTVTVDDLRAFHAKHFPNASTPEEFLHGVEPEVFEELYEEGDDDLGYYPDGTKRTLTDEQIAMFRHSEIQAIIRKRRQKRDNDDASEDGEITPDPTAKDTASPSISTVLPGTAPAETDRVTSGRVEKPTGQQWAKNKHEDADQEQEEQEQIQAQEESRQR